MNKTDVLKRINEIIVEEKGHPVVLDGLFTDAQLDSLGTMIFFITLDSEFDLFEQEDDFKSLDFQTLTVRDLVSQCILSNTSTSQQLNSGTDT